MAELDSLKKKSAADLLNTFSLPEGSLPLVNAWRSVMHQSSPLSQRITIEAFTHRLPAATGADLHAQILEQDFILAAHFCLHREFKEGVRALLVDKTKDAQWTHPNLHSVSDREVQGFFDAPDELKCHFPKGLNLNFDRSDQEEAKK